MVVMVKVQREGSEHCRTSLSKVVETASVASRAQGAAAKESDGGAGTEAAARQPPRRRRHSQSPLTPDSLDWGRRPLALVTA